MWVVRLIRIDCPNLKTSREAQGENELIDTDHGRSSDLLGSAQSSCVSIHMGWSSVVRGFIA